MDGPIPQLGPWSQTPMFLMKNCPISCNLEGITTVLSPEKNNKRLMGFICLYVEVFYWKTIFSHPEFHEKWKRDVDSILNRVDNDRVVISVTYQRPTEKNGWEIFKTHLNEQPSDF